MGVQKGAYVLADAPDGKKPEVILMATGSEVSLCVDAYEKLKGEGHRGARGVDAVVGPLRAAGRGVSRTPCCRPT